jgi:hypothetical protein
MPTATVHVAADDLQLSGSYEATGDMLYLSAALRSDRAKPGTPRGYGR